MSSFSEIPSASVASASSVVADCSNAVIPVFNCYFCLCNYKVSKKSERCCNTHPLEYLCNTCYAGMIEKKKKCGVCRGELRCNKINKFEPSTHFDNGMKSFWDEYSLASAMDEDDLSDPQRIMLGIASVLINIFKDHNGQGEEYCLKKCFLTEMDYDDDLNDYDYTRILFEENYFSSHRDSEGYLNLTTNQVCWNVIYKDEHGEYIHYPMAFYTLNQLRDEISDRVGDDFFNWADTHHRTTSSVIINAGLSGTLGVAVRQSDTLMNEVEEMINNESQLLEHLVETDLMVQYVIDEDDYAEILCYRWSEYVDLSSTAPNYKVRACNTHDTTDLYLLVGRSTDDEYGIHHTKIHNNLPPIVDMGDSVEELVEDA